jgi:hypothetical protein
MPTKEEIALLKQLSDELDKQNITLVHALLPDVGWRLEAVKRGFGQIGAVEHARLDIAKAGLLMLLEHAETIYQREAAAGSH